MEKHNQQFLGYALLKCITNHITVSFISHEKVLSDGVLVSGYYDGTKKELCVATKRPQKEYFPIFLHEFCHAEQDIENWTLEGESNQTSNDIWEWLTGKDIPMNRVKKSARIYQKTELDCEKRAVRYIKKYGLSIDIENYIKNANIYVYFYSSLLETRQWETKQSIFNHPELMKLVPDHFLNSYVKLPTGFTKIITNANVK